MLSISNLAYCVQHGLVYKVYVFDLMQKTTLSVSNTLNKDELNIYLSCLTGLGVRVATVGQFISCCTDIDNVTVYSISRGSVLFDGKKDNVLLQCSSENSRILTVPIDYFNIPNINKKCIYIK